MDLNDILEKLNNDRIFKKNYCAVIEKLYKKNNIKIYRNDIVVSASDENNPLVYNPDPFAHIVYSNMSSCLNKDNYCFYLAIVKGWFSTEIYVNTHIIGITDKGGRKLKLKPYKSSISNKLLIENIIDYIYCREFDIKVANNHTIVASNEYLCKKCNSNVI